MESPIKLESLTLENAFHFYREFNLKFAKAYFCERDSADFDLIDFLLSFASYPISNQFYWSLRHMCVKVSATDKSLISYYESPEKRKKVIRQSMKASRFIKRYLPWLDNKTIEKFSQIWKDNFVPCEYELIHSKEESAFIEAYSGKQLRGKAFYSTSVGKYCTKQLATSCMGKDFSDLPKHPAAAYASGDFSILYAKTKAEGLIAARVVIGADSCGPIYSQCSFAADAIANWLTENSISEEQDWNGLSLQAIRAKRNNYLMPYVDGYNEFSFHGDSFSIGGDIEFSGTYGLINAEPQATCDDCGESVSEYSLENAIDNYDERVCICADCRRSYSWSSAQDTWLHDSIVQYVSGVGNVTESWLEENGYVYTVDGEYCDLSDCVEYEGEYYPTWHSDVTIFNGEYYHEDSEELKKAQEKAEKEDMAHEYKRVYSWQWESIDNKLPWLEYKETVTRVLRDNYQMTDNGPIQIPTLPGIDWDSMNNETA